jgi:hypothetical protein
MTVTRFLAATLIVVGSSAAAQAQSGKAVFVGEPDGGKWQQLELVAAASDDAIAEVSGAPFTARAVTEFIQTLGDGNRIERRYESFIARDGRGRTRREEDVVLVGPLAAAGARPKLVTIVDPEADVSYTLNEGQRVAYKGQVGVMIVTENAKVTARSASFLGGPAVAKRLETEPQSGSTTTESLGRRSISGVLADGTRTTTTIPAGIVGNVQPIEIVSERWFSPDLQMPVLITRRDPRVGNTEYRLIEIHRGEPAAHLFTVPSDYEIREGKMAVWKKLEAKKINDAGPQKGGFK